MVGVVTAVSRSETHTLVKPNRDSIRLLAGLGVEGDAHMGETIKHRARVARDPREPNVRQVHLIHVEYYLSRSDAVRREKYLKTTKGKRALRLMLKDSLAEARINNSDE